MSAKDVFSLYMNHAAWQILPIPELESSIKPLDVHYTHVEDGRTEHDAVKPVD